MDCFGYSSRVWARMIKQRTRSVFWFGIIHTKRENKLSGPSDPIYPLNGKVIFGRFSRIQKQLSVGKKQKRKKKLLNFFFFYKRSPLFDLAHFADPGSFCSLLQKCGEREVFTELARPPYTKSTFRALCLVM